MPETIKVVFFQRKPLPIHKSVEFIFADVRSRMPAYVHAVTRVFRYYSKGIAKRLYIIWEAYRNQGDVNHITGDIQFSAILLERRKTMLTVLDCGMLSGSSGVKHLLLKYFWFTLPVKKCALLTVISKATKEELLKYIRYPEEQIHIVPVAISPAFTHHPKRFSETPVILQVGTMANKNIERLIAALRGIDCRLNIIGALSEPVKQLLIDNEIVYTNATNLSQAQLIEEYIHCDMISFVSTYEGFGMPILEGNATGRPVISSNILSMPEVAGNAACLVNPYEVADIRKGIEKIIGDKVYRDELIKNGLENCRRYDPQKIADMYLALYVQLGNS